MQLSRFQYRFQPAQPAQQAEPLPGAGAPLIVVLHGRGDSLQGFGWLPRALGLPGASYLFLNAPDPYFGGYSWYALPPDQGPGILRSREWLFGALDELRAQGFPSARTLLFGFSQGALMSVDVALRYPHALAGVVGVSGYVAFPERAADEAVPEAFRTRFLLTHGHHDDVLPIERSRRQAADLQGLGLPLEWREYPKAHTIDPERELPDLRAWVAARFQEGAAP
jgi:phospholipase/carboxylesterase